MTNYPIPLRNPFTEKQVSALRAGDTVTICGTLYTGRDRLHAHLHHGGAAPVPLRDQGVYHCGPIIIKEAAGWRVVAAGPTTSIREEPYMAAIIANHGVRVIIGKGGMGDSTRAACRDHGCVYLQAVGGAAASLASRIKAVRNVYLLEEFGATEAMWEFEVSGLEAFVGIDAHGGSLYDQVSRDSAQRLQQLLAL